MERLEDFRNGLLARPAFQRWAARFPFTRPVARRRARQLFDLCAGFVYSQVLLACERLGLLDRLVDGPLPRAELLSGLGLGAVAGERLLAAADALDLVRLRPGNRVALGEVGAQIVGNPPLRAMIAHHELLYRDLADPVALLRGDTSTALGRYWAYAGGDGGTEPDRVADYSTLMSASQPLVAEPVLDALDLSGRHCLLDIGGGEGRFLSAVAERHPDLALQLFDLPAVAERARERLAEQGLRGRVQVHPGNFNVDRLPDGADVVSLVRVLHDHDDGVVLALLRRVRAVLPDDGLLVIAEPLAETPGAERMGAAYFGLYLFAMGSGRPRSVTELGRLLEAAGFEPPRVVPTAIPLQTGLLLSKCKL